MGELDDLEEFKVRAEVRRRRFVQRNSVFKPQKRFCRKGHEKVMRINKSRASGWQLECPICMAEIRAKYQAKLKG